MTESLDHRFTKFLLEAQALKFGEFTLKSGRKSPYFINAGAFNDGRKIATPFSVLPTRAFRWASPPQSL